MAAKKKTCETSVSFEELFNRVECDTGLIFVDTPEESRVIKEVFRKYKGHSVQFWSLTQGLIEIPKADDPERFLPHDYASTKARSDSTGQLNSRGNIMNTFTIIEGDCRAKIATENANELKTIYILRDADKFFTQPGPVRALRDIIYLVSCSGSSVIITGHGVTIPNELEKDSCFVKIPYPTLEEILNKVVPNVQQRIERHNRLHTSEAEKVKAEFDPMQVSRACAGLTEDQILNTIGYSTTVKREIDIDLILAEKKAVINKSDILQYWVCDQTMDAVGGFANIKNWIRQRKYVIDSPNAKSFKAKTPKAIMLLGVQGSGKCAPLWTNLLREDKTWTKMGDIKIGDKVQIPSGTSAAVIQIFEHPQKKTIQLEFKDGRISHCGPEHLWKIYNKNFKSQEHPDGWKVVDTIELMRLMKQKDDTRRFYIPLIKDSDQGEKLTIHPYILGILIGDGCITGKVPVFTTNDKAVVLKVKQNLIAGYKISEYLSEEKCPTYSIVKDEYRNEENFYRQQLSLLGLQGKDCYTKFIPEICYSLSVSDKQELIRGLMDSDGSTDDNLSYSTSSSCLAIGVQRLLWSIGAHAHISHRDTQYSYKGEKLQGRSSFRVNIRYSDPRDLVSLERKKNTLSENYQYSDLKLEITNVEYTGTTEDMRCIMLDDEEHLYITDDYIVTHNTYIGKCIAQSLGVGLIKLEMGKVFAGLVGESEKRMRQALAQAEAAGGVILVDEIDKGLSGAGSSDKTDGGTTSRVIGTLLTWMSEDHPGVLLIATANDISNLNTNHPELLRKGRFDEIWFSDAPNLDERKEILRIHLKMRERDPAKFDIDKIAEICYDDESSDKTFTYTGAELEYAIDDAIAEKFAEGEGKLLVIGGKDDITTQDLVDHLKIIKPITFISKGAIAPMRKWASINARNVSDTEEKAEKANVGKKSNLNLRSSVINTEDIDV